MKIFNAPYGMFRRAVRAFIEKEVDPHVGEWEEAGQIPKSIWPRTEPGGGSDVAAIKTGAVRDGDHYVQRKWD